MGGTIIGGGLSGATPEAGQTIRIHSVETFGTVDGPGIRYVVFLQGCPLRCAYCHNRDTWDQGGGTVTGVTDLAIDIERYTGFLRPSGGGVTATGGEPLLQAGAVKDLFSLVRTMNLTTALDTSGYVTVTPLVRKVLELTDLVILDLKQGNDRAHQELTGVSSRKIRAFAETVSHLGKPLWIRHVVVPGHTTRPADVENLATFVSRLAGVQRVELLPYHELGKHKWEALGETYPLNGVPPPSKDEMKKVASIFLDKNLPLHYPDKLHTESS
ncbi:pyruvate formate lyase activating enzyme [Alkalispirochaeta americana]|uniref:Pyruvate formate-lyase-activating enzyme n=1 Tax=Alkalispirochaeta americana TaxID=159291 RepID=A0A1N6SYV2_9SPIO|nr:pyruvate formate-lyase-activating protein [Alkalispirochaeta americana]SIQ46194.1 pyruvate formate lyase activating enzyme [Alkalispirochaeta americana]